MTKDRLPGSVIAVLALLTAVAPLATDMYLPAFPSMADEFGTSASAVQLTLTAFMIGLAVGQLVIGPLSDRFGRRPLLLGGTLICAVSSAACAVAPTIETLTAVRFVTGFTGAAGIVLSRAVISDRAEGVDAAKAFSLMMLIGGVAPIVAPLLGGTLVGHIGWRGVFWVVTALAAIMFVGVAVKVAESLPAENRSAGGFSALKQDAGYVLGNRRFVGYTVSFALAFGVMFAYISASPFVLQNLLGLSTLTYSIAFACNALGLVAVSALNARLVGTVGPEKLLRVGIVVISVASTLLVVDSIAGVSLWPVLVLLWIAVSGLGLVMANATTLALAEVRQAAGTGSAVLGALQFGLAALVSPIVGLGGEGTAVPMASTMFACEMLSAAALALVSRRRLGATSGAH
ncbi:Bcr/CflA family drug resistance efflux transporter [Rhodococcoides trifolii]|uniref:Bcr/CflA family drug resistance efflux transporter n=1 Tax=Rhodococcoides trifolii TaxID=908250 RepID=A0A917FRW3_9NOCA|nr:Bcr/CflA family multidrug efflux MFS transporter [Rhodococcus trifolii]GGG02482.1 Bcr/CflA family drug resistance efflux transporter [Rhodococcus trifolii]